MHTAPGSRVAFVAFCMLVLIMALPMNAHGQTPATRPAAPRFEKEIAAFEREQRDRPAPPDPVVFTGSSSIVYWKTLAADFPGVPVVNRGFGGSSMDEVRAALPRTVLPLRPKTVIVYAGSHDLHGKEGKTPEQVLGEFAALHADLRAARPDVRIGFIACKPSLAKWDDIHLDRTLNALVQDYVRRERGAFYVDLWTALSPDGERPDGKWFRPDRNHLSAEAYAVLTKLVRAALDEGVGRKPE